MGDKSPKDRDKKKKQHERELADINRAKQEKAKKASQPVTADAGPNHQRKAG
jgi:hypothetical protein